MSYNFEHTEDDCDRCLKKIGKANLIKLPFLLLDCNDTKHKDMSYLWYDKDYGYRQYYVCKKCYKEQEAKKNDR